MPIVTCPLCKHAGNIPTSFVNQTVRCPKCKNPFTPGMDFLPPPSDLQAASNQAPPIPSSPGFLQRLGSQFPAAPAGEPWYYRYCHTVTILLLILDLMAIAVGIALWVFFGVVGVLVSKQDPLAFIVSYFFTSIFYAIWIGLLTISTLYFFTFVLIFIDAARHVRRIHAAVSGQQNQNP